ncbi:MAG: malectin domain-containing carbohydrate-binding protein, partial [Candidatus Limnocylindrales bacterium]
LPHPDGGGYGGAGLETDIVGNLWTVGQNSGNAYLVESGLPNFSDVPWLSVAPTGGTVASDGSQELTVKVDSTGLTPGVYHAIVVVQTNDPDRSNSQVPVILVVPKYQQGIDTGEGAYVDPANGNIFVTDRAFSAGGFGYVGSSSTRSTGAAIAGTERDPLYQDLRAGMTAYRFAVPNGTYRVDLSFAELQATRAGARVFNVSIEGAAVLSNLDVFAAAGGRYVALDRTVLVEVSDGVLDISFIAQRGDKPIINAILVTELPLGSPGL